MSKQVLSADVTPSAGDISDGTGSGLTPMTGPQLLSISAFWFATNVHWTALLFLLIPAELAEIMGDKQASSLGSTIGLGAALFALTVPLIVGPLSDRSVSRFGRRRPFMFAGVTVNVVGLLMMLYFIGQRYYWGYLAGFMMVQLGNNIATGAYQGVIPDVVPIPQRGIASGYMGMMSQLGSALGIVVVGLVFRADPVLSYGLLITVLTVCLLWTAFSLKEQPLRTQPAPINWIEFIKGLWIDPRKYPDFAWVWITRALVMYGFYTIQPFVLYYLRDIIHVDDPVKMSGLIFLFILIAATISGIYGGALSDRIGRKVIVYIANGTMAAMALCLVFCTTLPQAIAVGVIFGLGYGAYISVDWALGTDVLPNKEEAGKDMAVWHIAMVFPQAIAVYIAGSLLGLFGHTTEKGALGQEIIHYTARGYTVMFGIAAVALALGAVLLRNVRTAR